MKKYILLFLMIASILNTGCSESEFDQIIPSPDLSSDEVLNDIRRAGGLINPVYGGVRSTPRISLEYFTNNAVEFNGAKRAAVSGATAENSPVSGEWNLAIDNIFRINEFFKYVKDIKFDALDEERSEGLKKRTRGEAFGLRAYYKWLLLKNFAGPSATDGTMLGFPIIDDLLTINEANSVPRSTYLESYNSIKKDLDSAYKYIEVFRYEGDADVVAGAVNTSRITREAIWALRARLDLFAASPAYEQIPWEQAAQTAYDAIIAIDGGVLKPLSPYGNFDETDNKDHLWRKGFSSNGNLERAHYPPSMFGNGNANPSQNLVDAFADKNGFPITHPNSIYNAIYPYEDREGRFERFVFYNGQNDYRNVYIEVFDGGKDANGSIKKQATRTGYYLKKYLSENVNFDPDQTTGSSKANKMYPIFTRAGLYLDFAEAAVEAYGVNGSNGSMAFTAKDALVEIRTRAGINNDLYIDIADDLLDTYIDLIRNERRVEFAFEGEYYYDVRRWKLPLELLTEPVKGVEVTRLGEDSFTYEEKQVESRNFSERMYYNPIPRNQVLSSNALIQNAGWQ
ncbi:RagB/SusD family nutrient uptake outer membrane protein [Flavivirga abyssicola]|uniref:RagB/SusD family nutrient uptake outer membrane protein n=1 Tax=Flavivirga abyssicola TaxID=3063533 RepID=UPI0026E0AF8D|nr:RagB/SusD family nutrient uptake outer membrane protein [Flavivirga sp. MEBiC07777]WVK11664.1 RagB/SusD family nutrient uptake outer membrane protein [Flavivirga sp. MEBiC07777]